MPQPDEIRLLPGMTASVRIVVKETVGVLKVPNATLRFSPPGIAASAGIQAGRNAAGQAGPGIPTTVWVLDDQGQPVPVMVRVGESDRRATEILSGPLTLGQNVIIGASVADDGPSVFGLRLNF